MRSTLAFLGVAVAASTLLSGCYLRSFVAFYDQEMEGGEISVNAEVSVCAPTEGVARAFVCTYEMRDIEPGAGDVGAASTLEVIADEGVEGAFVQALLDPVVLQVPAGMNSFVATYNNAGSPQALVLTETTSFPVSPGITVQAEPGTKFVILELPDAVAAALPPGTSSFDFSLEFASTGPSPLVVKPMLTASVDQAGTRYYLPLLPCVTDFAQVPEIQIPASTGFEDLRPQAYAIATGQSLACDGMTYDLRTSVAPTTTTTQTTPQTTIAATGTPSAPSPTPATVLPATGVDTSLQIWMAIGLIVCGATVLVGIRRRSGTGG